MSEDTTKPNTTATNDWKERELGALWRREGKSQNFLSGMIRVGDFGVEKEIKVIVFTNKGKAKNERAPDFIIYEDKPREAVEAPQAAAEGAPVAQADSDLPASLQ